MLSDLDIVKMCVKIPFKYRRLFNSKTPEQFTRRMNRVRSIKDAEFIKNLFDEAFKIHAEVMNSMKKRLKELESANV